MSAAPALLRCRRLLAHAHAEPQADVGVLTEAGTIVAVGPWSEVHEHTAGVRIITLDGLVMPGLVDAHSHLRGLPLADQEVLDGPLEAWLLRLRTLTKLSPGDEALVGAADLVSTGVTSVQGVLHGLWPPAEYARHLTDVILALTSVGLRAEVMMGLTDQAEYAPPRDLPAELAASVQVDNGTDGASFQALVETARRRWNGPLIRIGAAPVAPQWCSDAVLEAVSALYRGGARVHTHLLESPWQRRWLHEDPVSRLRRWELPGPQLSVAHAVWLDDAELAELASACVTPVHCSSSNAGLQVGRARVRAWLDAGLTPALGLDSHHESGVVDAFAEMRSVLATAAEAGQPLTAREVLAMATTGGAAALGQVGRVGQIAPGFSADLLSVDLETVGLHAVGLDTRDPAGSATDGDDLVDVLLARGAAAMVSHVICAGRELVVDGVLHCADEVSATRQRLVDRVRSDAPARAARQRSARAVDEALMQHLRGLELGYPGDRRS